MSTERVLTGAIVVVVTKDGSMETEQILPDAPVVPRVVGIVGADGWLEHLVDDLQEATSMGAAIQASPGLPTVAELLGANASKEGRHIGYMGVDQISATFSISCGDSNAEKANGRIVTWSMITQGVLTCGIEPEPQSMAVVAQRYC